jgi:biotin transport system substrate-specific component
MSVPTSAATPVLRDLVRQTAVVLFGTLLITAAAKVQIPFFPVPMTLHTLAVMGLAVSVGPRLTAATLLAYLGAGALGFPVFSGTPERGIGLAYMMGPTGGYLAGYLVGAVVTSALALGRGTVGKLLAMLAGLAIIYALGLAWLGLFVPANKLVAAGFLPFILGDLLKVALVAAGALLPWNRIGGMLGR